MEVLNVSHLYKKFGTKEIIHDVNFNIEEGEIVGFVGPNGAGKTTTMKLITNLIFPTNGEIKINGFDVIKDREKALSNISALIENPGLYKNLSGMQNLKMIQRLNGNTDEEVKEIIKQIGLEDKIHRKASRYSLGMKQRLAIGMCLLSNPKFLILDEPTNGLDPTGIIDLRNFIENLARERQIAILLSSHILSEVEKICSRIIFIKDGKIIPYNKANLDNEILYKMKVSEIEKANNILLNNKFISSTSIEEDDSIIIHMKENHLNDILKDVVEKDIEIIDIEKEKTDLESVYYDIFKE